MRSRRPGWSAVSLMVAASVTSTLAQEIVFEDDFEFGETLSWTRSTNDVAMPLEGGGTLLLRDGTLAPGTTVEVTAVATPPLPGTLVAVGNAFEIVIDPPPLFPVTLTLPAKGRGPATGPIVLTVDGDKVRTHDTNPVGSFVQGLFTEDANTMLAAMPSSGAFLELFLVASPAPSGNDVGLGTGETVTFEFFWNADAELLTIDFGDGPPAFQPLAANARQWVFQHQYLESGRYPVWGTLLALPETPGASGNESDAGILVRVNQDPRGLWASDSGNILFERQRSSWRGTYQPGQHGLITGTYAGQILVGHWIETFSLVTCNSFRLDSEGEASDHWGQVRFEFNADFTEFCGVYSYCDQNDMFSWNGWRQHLTSDSCASRRATPGE